MNKVELIGRITADPELRYTESEKAYTRFTLAVNRKYKKDDELKEIITNLYSFIQTMPEPEKWLEAAVEEYNLDSLEE